ncbi:MAG: tryptophan synthase subunit alpha, partial [Candidatus Margulisiibacteriota bacterium]
RNVSLADVFKLVSKVRKRTQIPLCFMLSYNLIYRYGIEKFYRDCEKVGVDGVLVPDLPPEDQEVGRILAGYAVDNIFFVAPTTAEERIKLIAENSKGFIYLISVAGITGKREKLTEDLPGLVSRVRKYSKLPIAVGFGISNVKQAIEAAKIADGVIVGSALVELVGKGKIKEVAKFVASLRKGLDTLPKPWF